ncbi:hypothetical protein AA309_24740 [Microvirga vignae]|uniref:Phosphoserine aminotransferase n=1 Tax=Microvirga vignae TaxID=1225564 RepID=A0A0H1R705_9HYPH|nr:hypothetical protein AA309_24740 [Microvirga vignae]
MADLKITTGRKHILEHPGTHDASPAQPQLLLRPLRQAPGLDTHDSGRCGGRALPLLEARQGGAGAVRRGIVDLLEREGVAYDVASYRDAPPGPRLWSGATVEDEDMQAVLSWLDWAFAQVITRAAAA